MFKVVFIRHGESIWNKKKLFTGWTDVDLTQKGIKEAEMAASVLKENDTSFDVAFTSYLKKAIRTLWIIFDKNDCMWIPVEKTWRLNERHYGALQGLSKSSAAKKLGKDKVHAWRRSYDVRPPAVDREDDRFPGNDKKYSGVNRKNLPFTESLKDVQKRVLLYWEKEIIPCVREGRKVLIVSHGNCLRALVKHICDISDNDVMDLNIPTGMPFAHEFDHDFNSINHYYYGDPEEAEKAARKVAGELEG
jgi:2,3-bisphosphoglycerate-dependent phosphoglycerate mutase